MGFSIPRRRGEAMGASSSRRHVRRHHLQYWRPGTVDINFEGEHKATAGETLKGVAPDDVVWTVTVRDGRLRLVGRLVAGRCGVSRHEAARWLGRRPAKLWDSNYWVLAKPGTEQSLRE